MEKEEKQLSEETKNLFIEYFKVPGETPDNPIGFPLTGLEVFGTILNMRWLTGTEKGENIDLQLQLYKDEQSGIKFFKVLYLKSNVPLPFFSQGENLQVNFKKTNELIQRWQKLDFLISKLFDIERGFIWNQTFCVLAKKAIDEVGSAD